MFFYEWIHHSSFSYIATKGSFLIWISPSDIDFDFVYSLQAHNILIELCDLFVFFIEQAWQDMVGAKEARHTWELVIVGPGYLQN